MHDTHSIAALRSTLQYTKSSTMPADHKVLLIALLTEALRDQQEQNTKASALENSAKPWKEADTAALQTFLAGKVATSWQHADEMSVLLASELGRQPQDVRSKAIDLGFGAGLDFRLARALMAERARAEDERDAGDRTRR
jgi:hypothetical protein